MLLKGNCRKFKNFDCFSLDSLKTDLQCLV